MPFKKLYSKMFKSYVDISIKNEEDNETDTNFMIDGKALDEKNLDDKINHIDQIVEIAKDMSRKEGQITLWASVFKLEKWYIITRPDEEDDLDLSEAYNSDLSDVNKGGKPFVGSVNGTGWIFAFTDLEHANRFAVEYKLSTRNDVARTIEMRPFQAVDWMHRYKAKRPGITGVSFNEGKYGWHIPIYNLESIRSLLLNKKIIKRPKK